MSNSPFDLPLPPPPAVVTEEPPAGGGRGRTVALVGGLLAIVGLAAGGAAFAWSQVSGGGAQPETVLPASTVAFAKVDLDPSASQKLDAIRFVRKFPTARGQVSENADLRQLFVKSLQDDGQLEGIDYAKDIEPWLGERAAVGFVPNAAGDDADVIVVLAVRDHDKATQSLPKVARSLIGQCEVLEEYAVCARDAEKLLAVRDATKKGTLADSASFRTDLHDLGEDGIATAWVDSTTAGKVIGSRGADLGSAFGLKPEAATLGQGRTALALRFDGPHLELAGHVNGSKSAVVGSAHADGVGALPEGTLAAVSVANAGDQFRASWPELEATLKAAVGEQELTDGLAQVQDALGITVPDDLAAALGSQFSVVFGGTDQEQGDLKLAVVSNGDPDVLRKLADGAGQGLGAGALTVTPSGRGTVLTMSDRYAQELTTGSGLGDTDRFKDAVKHPEQARVVAFADISGLLAQFKDRTSDRVGQDLGALSAVGFTASGEGTSGDFSLRITTK